MSLDGSDELRLLAEIARWTREAALPVVRERVERLVDTDAKKRVYDAMADGAANVTAIEKSTGVNHAEARKWMDEWEGEGLAVPDATPPKAMFTLRELGIPSPPPRTPRKRARAT
jgi:transposase-like protein